MRPGVLSRSLILLCSGLLPSPIQQLVLILLLICAHPLTRAHALTRAVLKLAFVLVNGHNQGCRSRVDQMA